MSRREGRDLKARAVAIRGSGLIESVGRGRRVLSLTSPLFAAARASWRRVCVSCRGERWTGKKV